MDMNNFKNIIELFFAYRHPAYSVHYIFFPLFYARTNTFWTVRWNANTWQSKTGSNIRERRGTTVITLL